MLVYYALSTWLNDHIPHNLVSLCMLLFEYNVILRVWYLHLEYQNHAETNLIIIIKLPVECATS